MKQFLISLDQTVNTLFFETEEDGTRVWGWADESISARSYRLRDKGWALQYKLINKLFFWQIDHCGYAYYSEELRSQLPREYR